MSHIFLKHFRKIRCGSFLAQATRKEKLKMARQELAITDCEVLTDRMDVAADNLQMAEMNRYPKCHIGILRAIEIDRDYMYKNWLAYIDSS